MGAGPTAEITSAVSPHARVIGGLGPTQVHPAWGFAVGPWPRSADSTARSDTWVVDSYEGTATLEWWGNRSACLGRFGVRVAVRVTGGDWMCEAFLEPPLAEEEWESFDFLMRLDPLFTLHFDEESALPVSVVAAGSDGRLVLSAYQAEAVESAGSG